MRGGARRRLYAEQPPAEADVRPTLLGIVTLMFLLLFFLLSTSSGQRLGTIALRFGAASDLAPLPHSGVLRALRVRVLGEGVEVVAEVATTDIAASASSSELRRWEVSSAELPRLNAIFDELHGLDPAQERAAVFVGADVVTDQLIEVLDLVRGPGGSRFPTVSLAGLAAAP